MSIRWKLMLLLLVVAMVPLVVLRVIDARTTHHLHNRIRDEVRDELTTLSEERLRDWIATQSVALNLGRQLVDRMLQTQARQVEYLLTHEDMLETGRPLYFMDDLATGGTLPPNMVPAHRYEEVAGKTVLVSYSEQCFLVLPGKTRQEMLPLARRMQPLADTYRWLHEQDDRFELWHYTTLDVGLHSSYPAATLWPKGFDPRTRPWYQQARDTGQIVWIPPYIDALSGDVVLTVAMPVYKPDNTFAGVTAIDISLADLFKQNDDTRGSRQALETGVEVRIVQLDENGGGTPKLRVLAEPSIATLTGDWRKPLKATDFQLDDPHQQTKLLGDISQNRSDVMQAMYRDQPVFVAYSRAGDSPMALLAIVPLERVYGAGEEAASWIDQAFLDQLFVTGVIVLLLAGGLVLIAVYGSRTVTQPIRDVAAAVEEVAKGQLAARAPVRGRDEVGTLARSFNTMVPQLRDRIRMKQALDVAMDVQHHLLPQRPPTVPGLDIAGCSIYCDETGGDYYDFIDLEPLGPNQLGVAVGDVTGHGIAAALLMTTGRALLRSHAGQPHSLADVFNQMNANLVADMADGRFMTLYYLVIDTETHIARWVSAGHDPAIVYDPNTGVFQEWEGFDIPLGVQPNWAYREGGPASLQSGQVIVIGTDGIWESRNNDRKMFGKDRLKAAIRENADQTAEGISQAVIATLRTYRQDQPQEDDVTLVVMKVR